MPPLPDWVDGKRALYTLANALNARGLTLLTQARFNDTHDTNPVMLPGFSMFDRSHGTAASDWCVPRPRVDREEVIAVYEAYVDRPLGRVNVPDRIARQVYKGPAADTFFGGRRTATEWWLPAAQLVAVASRLSKVQAVLTDDTVTLDMGDYTMSAAPVGCWSNSANRLHRAMEVPDDANVDLLRVPMLMTSHPLAKALVSVAAPSGILWAANSAIRCEALGRLPRIRVSHLSPRGLRSPTAPKQPRLHKTYDEAAAMGSCRLIIDDPYPGSHRDLFLAAVPALMRGVDFADLVGVPGQNPERMLSEEACERFSNYLDLTERTMACNP